MQSSWWNKEPHLYMLRVAPLDTHCCRSLVLLERSGSVSTEIILSSRPVLHPASVLVFWFRRVQQARMQVERKCGNVWNWWIASYFTQHQKAYCFYSLLKVEVVLLYHLLFYFHPCQIPFLMSNQPAPPWDTGKTWGWFSLYETEKLTLCWDSWDIAISSFSLSVAPSCMSGIHRHWGRLMFVWILKVGCLLGMNTLQQLLNFASWKVKAIPVATKKQKRNQTTLQFSLISAWEFCFCCKITAH